MIKKIGYIFVLLILIALGGSGWFFSGVIYEGALNPEFNDSQSIGTAEDRVIVSGSKQQFNYFKCRRRIVGPTT
jgi:hypothetical protein